MLYLYFNTNNFSQLLTETDLVEVYLRLCSNTVITVKVLTLKLKVEARQKIFW